ncbi:hypothetical protein P3X46_007644 [Hevea brasiliensis]|uniref:Uncharacterized protein n=2 Tax=Hevea brasiliensis TaxID=3981 RepID=A0ABQ9MWM2_HEVBR|nr:hypothetical protein P3X46_007644 [Hevea brasiliensis]KAJ9183838.1 hypothetical protein P3X46_007644 [Hevea brasiliensis]
MKDKRNAEKTEAQLLDTFDYAWNKGSNGARRPNDILLNISKIALSSNRFSSISKRLLFQRPGQGVIKIEANKPLSPEKCTIPADEDEKSFLIGIFKFNRSQPRLVSDKCGIDQDFIHICGFIMNDSIPCRRPPVPGRKRCEGHKGMRIYGSSSKPISEGNSNYLPGVHLDPSTHYDHDHATTCGVNLGDGIFCRRQAVPGRKRCEEHKGMRVNSCVSKPIAEEECHPANSGSMDWTNNIVSSGSSMYQGLQFHSPNDVSIDEHFSSICGAILGNGSFCRRQPTQGNKQCWQHKGWRGDSNLSGSSISRFDTVTCWQHKGMYQGLQFHSPNDVSIDEHFSSICGATLGNGSFCRRQPTQGNKRCWQHKGRRGDSSLSGSSISRFDTVTCWQHEGMYQGLQFHSPNEVSIDEHFSSICGATLGNGLFCRRQPTQGNKRCWQHKGRRGDGSLSGSSISRFDTVTCGVALQNGSVCMRAPVHGRKRCEQHKGMRVSTSFS